MDFLERRRTQPREQGLSHRKSGKKPRLILALAMRASRLARMRNTNYTSPDTGRTYWIDDRGLATPEAYYEWHSEAEAEGERRAEFAMSWVMGGGQSSDINAAYRMHVGGAA